MTAPNRAHSMQTLRVAKGETIMIGHAEGNVPVTILRVEGDIQC